MKACENCNEPALKGERFCKVCRKVILDRLRATPGFLPPKVRHTNGRTDEQRENVRETRFGTDR